MMLVGMSASSSILEYTSEVTMFSASCVIMLGLLVPYGAGANISHRIGVFSVMAILGDLMGADFGVGILYWTRLELHAVGLIGGTTPGVLLQVFLR